jgi:hypothetical protein
MDCTPHTHRAHARIFHMIISVVCGRTKQISLCLLKYEIKSPFLIYSHVVNSVLFWLILWALNELMACVASINWITIYYSSNLEDVAKLVQCM